MQHKNHANNPILLIGVSVYLSLLILFAWQTWQFIDWLFPQDDLGWKIITVSAFDGMAFLWGIAHSFYSYHSRGAKQYVTAGWFVTFLVSLIASILSMILHSYFRFHVAVDPSFVGLGYGVAIFAVTYNILTCMAWLLLEWKAMHPHLDFFERNEQIAENNQEGNRKQEDSWQIPQGNTRILSDSGKLAALPESRVIADYRRASPRNTRQRAAAQAIIGKYGRETVLGNLEVYSREAGIDRKTLKRYTQE